MPRSCSIGASARPGGTDARTGRIRGWARAACGAAASAAAPRGVAATPRGRPPFPRRAARSARRTPSPCRRSSCTPTGRRPRTCRAARCPSRARVSTSRKPQRVNSHSPPATGIGLAAPHFEVARRDRPVPPAPRTSRCRGRRRARPSVDRLDRVEAVIGVEHQADVRADRLAHRADQRARRVDVEADLQLRRVKAFGDVAAHLVDDVVERIAVLAPIGAGGVGAHLACAADRPSARGSARRSACPLRSHSAMSTPDSAVIASPFWPWSRNECRGLPRSRRWRARPGRRAGAVGVHDRGVEAAPGRSIRPTRRAVLGDDLDEARAARARPVERPGERLGQRSFENVGADVGDAQGVRSEFRPLAIPWPRRHREIRV